MSEYQAKICELVQILPEEKIKLIFALLFETALNSDVFKDDTEYFGTIPGYIESVKIAMAEPISQCKEDIGWDIP